MSSVEHESTQGRSVKFRIGIVTPYMPPHFGGIETVAEALFNAYRAAGHEVRWIASDLASMTSPRQGEGHILVPSWNWLERSLGVPWPMWGPQAVRKVADLVRWADVLHIHDCLYMGSAVTLFLARRACKPVLLSQHNGFIQYRSAVLRGIEWLAHWTIGRTVLNQATCLIFCNPAAEEFVTSLLHHRPPDAKTIPLGIDTNRFKPPTTAERKKARQILGLPETGALVIFVGRLVKKKGIDLFLEVMRRCASFHFLIVGRGNLSRVSSTNVTWLPSVPPERLPLIYQAGNVFLLPSYDEGIPLTVLEAMATGLPVIMTEGSLSRLQLERDGGCLLAKGEPSALCERLTGLLENPPLAARIGGRSRDLVIRNWSLETMEASYLDLIQNLTAPKDPYGIQPPNV